MFESEKVGNYFSSLPFYLYIIYIYLLNTNTKDMKILETKNCVLHEFAHGSEIINSFYGDYEFKYSKNKDKFEEVLIRVKKSDSWTWGDVEAEQTKKDISDGICRSEKLLSEFIKAGKAASNQKVGMSVKRRKVKSDYDGEINIDSVMAGGIMPFEKKTKINGASRQKEIVIIYNVNYGINHNEYRKRIISVLPAVYKESLIGYNVKVRMVSMVERLINNDSRIALTDLTIKDYDQRFDIHRAAIMSYMGYYRWATFINWVRTFDRYGIISSHLGGAVNHEKLVKKYCKEVFSEGTQVYHIETNTKFTVQ